ncbi:hypothetical protein GUY44_12205 [Pimelobacter simplex]|uniref:SLOG domain-containing protein n=1 Tax=Nocardioides simplex TaxID=2045 RepID=UPI0005361754|nr:hypothetical protein [Pimelobacter simplex]MCG8151246.1 hypothetical protein [Pimelobacter simplex]GEB12201.1 hypothetical protein NSI01_05160 [Pimelobacter simplex]
MTRVVLCASFPSGPRAPDVEPYYSTDIALAVVAVAEATLRSGARLVFGAHPTISPIVLHTARMLDAGRLVTIFQSAFFESSTTEAVRMLTHDLGAHLRTTKRAADRPESLTIMRTEMFASRPDCAFFCGGMDGLDEEHRIARTTGTTTYLITEPGGRTAQLALDATAESRVLEGRAYSSLALAALERSGAAAPRPVGPLESVMYDPDDEAER